VGTGGRKEEEPEERRCQGIAVKDRLTREDGATMKRLPARIRPRFRDHARDRSPVIHTVLKSGVQGEEKVTRRPASTARKTNYNRGRPRAQVALGARMHMLLITVSEPQGLRGLLYINFEMELI
jgi:hypothetical protein